MKTILIALAAGLLCSGCIRVTNYVGEPAPVAWWALTNKDGSPPRLRTEDGPIYWKMSPGTTNSPNSPPYGSVPPLLLRSMDNGIYWKLPDGSTNTPPYSSQTNAEPAAGSK